MKSFGVTQRLEETLKEQVELLRRLRMELPTDMARAVSSELHKALAEAERINGMAEALNKEALELIKALAGMAECLGMARETTQAMSELQRGWSRAGEGLIEKAEKSVAVSAWERILMGMFGGAIGAIAVLAAWKLAAW